MEPAYHSCGLSKDIAYFYFITYFTRLKIFQISYKP
jgi:hypothetical protein